MSSEMDKAKLSQSATELLNKLEDIFGVRLDEFDTELATARIRFEMIDAYYDGRMSGIQTIADTSNRVTTEIFHGKQ